MYGEGIIKGMAETAKNFFTSYTDEKRLTTVQYPEERLPMTPNTRNFPFLVFDNDPEKGLRCVACKICEKECPPQCIYIILDRDEKGKPRKHPRIFDIDISVCMSCQICAEVCPFDAIKMDQVYELSRTDRFEDLLLHKQELAKSNEYYHTIHPDEAAEVDARVAEEKAKAAAAAAAKAAAPKPAASAPPPASAAPTPSLAAAKPTAGGATSPASATPPPAKPVEVVNPVDTTSGQATKT
jgi:NADH-quinone oxidoreductase subunit I